LFVLSGDACIEDLEWTLEELAATRREHQEEILGAVMYSCNDRGGPTASALMRGETMADATRFARVFNHHDSSSSPVTKMMMKTRNVPCLGFYTFGEIGPLALAGRQRRPTSTSQATTAVTTTTTTTSTVFQRGGVALHRSTVVFALFVAPVFDLSSSPAVDDSKDNVRAYFARSHAQQ
jgi:hypothetical protein